MSHCTSSMIGIRTGGVFSGDADIEDLKKRIVKVAEDSSIETKINDRRLGWCSADKNFTGPKGSYFVMAGVFNYWFPEDVLEFARLLSKEFGVEVMAMAFDEDTSGNPMMCNVFIDGKSLYETNEGPIASILRRIS